MILNKMVKKKKNKKTCRSFQCYIFQVRVSFLNMTTIFLKIEASNNEHSFNRFFVAVWNLTNWPLIGQQTQSEQKEPVRT